MNKYIEKIKKSYHCERSEAIQSPAPCHCERSAAIQSNKVALKFATILLTLSFLLSLTSCKKEEANPTQKPTIKIGVTLPLTGDVAEVGNINKDTIVQALKDYGDTKFNYELIFEDDMVLPKKGVMNTRYFINVKKVDAIISQWTPVAAVVSPLAQANEIIHFTCAFGYKVAEGEYNFNNTTSFEEQSKVLVSKLKKENIKSLSYVVANTSGCVEQSEYVINKLKENDIEVLDVNHCNPTEKDFRFMISKMEQKKPEYYILCSISPATEIFLKDLELITGKRNVTSIDTFYEMNSQYRSQANDLWFVSSALGTDRFRTQLKNKINNEAVSCTANLYDSTKMLIAAYENAVALNGEKPNKEDVIDFLHNIKNYTDAMEDVSIDSDGFVQSKANIAIIRDGNPVLLEEN
ncbi:MAG: ABC transporter substrate-binding protein [Alphaproteobacteria bacterium]